MPTYIREFIDSTFHSMKGQVGTNSLAGLSSGFEDFDALTGGLQAGCLIVIAGRPSMGKTAFANNIILNASLRNRVPTLVFSTETSKEELAKQLLLSNSSVDPNRLRTDHMRENDWNSVQISVDELKGAPLLLDDSIELTSSSIATKCREVFQKQVALGLVVIDSIQLVRESEQNGECHNVRTSAKALKALAVELSVPIVILSQISRGPEYRDNHRPILSDCPIGDEADVIILVYREEYYDPECTTRGEADIIIARNRRGVTGTVTLRFDGRTRNFLSPPVRDFICKCECECET